MVMDELLTVCESCQPRRTVGVNDDEAYGGGWRIGVETHHCHILNGRWDSVQFSCQWVGFGEQRWVTSRERRSPVLKAELIEGGAHWRRYGDLGNLPTIKTSKTENKSRGRATQSKRS